MAEQDFLQNNGTPDLPTPKSQAIDKLVNGDSEVKPKKEKDYSFRELSPEKKKLAVVKAMSKLQKEKQTKQINETAKRNVMTKKEKFEEFKSKYLSKKATGPMTYRRQSRPEVTPPASSGRFYAPDSTFGVDRGVRELGRFPMGAGVSYHYPPMISTDATGQARARLRMNKPPMFGGK
jgi:hypothetical protein